MPGSSSDAIDFRLCYDLKMDGLQSSAVGSHQGFVGSNHQKYPPADRISRPAEFGYRGKPAQTHFRRFASWRSLHRQCAKLPHILLAVAADEFVGMTETRADERSEQCRRIGVLVALPLAEAPHRTRVPVLVQRVWATRLSYRLGTCLVRSAVVGGSRFVHRGSHTRSLPHLISRVVTNWGRSPTWGRYQSRISVREYHLIHGFPQNFFTLRACRSFPALYPLLLLIVNAIESDFVPRFTGRSCPRMHDSGFFIWKCLKAAFTKYRLLVLSVDMLSVEL